MARGKEVAKAEENLPAMAAPPAWADRLAGKAGAGMEDVKAADMAMPFFRLLQSLSPETKRSESAHIEGAEEGMWLDTISREIFDEIIFVPCRYMTHYIEWAPRSSGGGLVQNHGKDASVLKQCRRHPETGRDTTPTGNEIIATPTWFGLVIAGLPAGEAEAVDFMRRAVITMPTTQAKVSKRWISDAMGISLVDGQGRSFTPPLYAMAYKLGAVATKNDKGTWMIPTVNRAGWVLDFPNGEAILSAAEEFAALAEDLQPEPPAQSAPAPADGAPEADGPAPAPYSGDIPF